MSLEDYNGEQIITEESMAEDKKQTAIAVANEKTVVKASTNNYAIDLSETSDKIITERLQVLDKIANIVKGALIKNIDYGYIPGCGNKPSLFQPGARKICLLYGFKPKYSMPMVDNENKNITIKCEIISSTGNIINESFGCAHINQPDEIKHGKVKDNGYYFNVALKMASKRAFVGAVLGFSNLSAVFTQDLEDDPNNKQIITQDDKQIVYDLVSGYVEAQKLNPKARKENWLKFCNDVQALAIEITGEELVNAYYIAKSDDLLNKFKAKYNIQGK